jgi:biofilm PGA synthesis N-glycosyltransferase PgaC
MLDIEEAEDQIEIVTPTPALRRSDAPSAPAQPLISLHALLCVGAVRIAYIASKFPAPSETFVYREVRELRKRGWQVSTVSLHDQTDLTPELNDLWYDRRVLYGSGWKKTLKGFGSELLNQFPTTMRTLWTALKDAIFPGERTGIKTRIRLLPQAVAGIGLARGLLSDGVSHIHCHFAHAPATIGMYAAMQLGVPFSFTGHANDLFQRRALLKRKLERAAFVCCISRWHREYYRNISPASDRTYQIVRCGVDSKSWTTTSHCTDAAPVQILTVCRLVPKKGVDLLMRGLAAWKPIAGWKLTIAGDGPERPALEHLTLTLGIRNSVEFLGAVDNQQVRNLLQSTNVFALACRTDSSGDRDGIPVVLMEAMACGVPVISGDLPAIRELVIADQTGQLVDSNDPAAWVKAFDRLATDTVFTDAVITAGRAMVQQEFDLQTNVTTLMGALEKTVRQSRGAAHTDSMNGLPTPSRKYALITPCRDEARYARRTLDAVVTQTIRPTIWVIVDDGSTDETPKILAEYAERYPFIKIVQRADRGDRKLGGGVIDAYYAGYDTINPADYDYVCKLDLDLDLPQKYFQTLMERMEQNPRLGTTSGKPYYMKDGRVVPELCGDENSVGMVKFYRTDCFTQIGGYVRELMWDGIDCHRCRQLGWIAVSWPDPGLQFEHLRPMGTSHKSWWTGRVRHGVGQYFMGTGPVYMLASAIFRMAHPPVIVGGTANLWGYLKSFLQRKPRYGDKAFRKFLRRYQWSALVHGKRKATEMLNARQARVWNPSEPVVR